MAAARKREAKRRNWPPNLYENAGSTFAFYAIFSSVFGDGYMELSKHATLIVMGLICSATGVAGMLIESVPDLATATREDAAIG